MSRCVALATTLGRRCRREALPEFGTCLGHTPKAALLAALRTAAAR